MATQEQAKSKKGNSLSNKRIKEFKNALMEEGFDKTERIIEILCKIVDFNPVQDNIMKTGTID